MTEGESGEHPKWLLELENRRRKPRLAHEAGAGAPCVICNVACPGLDLHFWRKICKNCKCSKDDHDIDDEDFPQFNLLLGTSRKYKKKPILLHINKEKEQAEETFEWVPPNTTEELAADYMKALPVERLPIKGSAGAALRRQLLHKQLPLHDIDYKTCDELTDQEKKQFEKYLENIKKLVGQATVIKALSARPYDGSLVTPINATDMQKFSPINKSTVHSSMVHLRTPSSFAPKCSYKQSSYDKASFQNPAGLSTEPGNNSYLVENIPTVEKYNIDKCNIDVVKSEPVVNGLRGIGPNTNSNNRNVSKQMATDKNLKPLSDAIGASLQTALPVNLCESYKEAYKDMLNSPSNALLNSASVNDESHMAEAMLADALLPPSTVHASDIIGSTLDEKGLSYIREKLTNKYSNQENIHPQFGAPSHVNSIYKNNVPRLNGKETGNATFVAAENELPVIDQPQTQNQTVEMCKPAEAEKAAIKPNSSNVIHSYPTNSMQPLSTAKLLAASTNADNSFSPSQPRHQAQLNSFATPSTVIHSEKLQSQVFPYENAAIVKTCDNGPFNPEYLKGALQELTIDTMKPQKCHKCAEEIRVGDVAIVAEKAKNAMWHPGCFVCNVCDELLVDLVYFYYKNKLYCGRDLATLLGIPRCFACDELIFVREYTVAEGHNYHVKHFCCWDCDIPLAGKQYITENDRPLCLICYQKTYAKTCDTCEKVIAADQQGVAVKDLNFHATGNCFCCYVCHQNLLNGRFAVKERRVLCSKECISKYLNMQNT